MHPSIYNYRDNAVLDEEEPLVPSFADSLCQVEACKEEKEIDCTFVKYYALRLAYANLPDKVRSFESAQFLKYVMKLEPSLQPVIEVMTERLLHYTKLALVDRAQAELTSPISNLDNPASVVALPTSPRRRTPDRTTRRASPYTIPRKVVDVDDNISARLQAFSFSDNPKDVPDTALNAMFNTSHLPPLLPRTQDYVAPVYPDRFNLLGKLTVYHPPSRDPRIYIPVNRMRKAMVARASNVCARFEDLTNYERPHYGGYVPNARTMPRVRAVRGIRCS